MNRKEFIAKDDKDFVEKAVYFANNAQLLAVARKTWRDEFLKSPVVAGYTEAVERKYQDIWKAYCEQ